jgi:hypothetical protein
MFSVCRSSGPSRYGKLFDNNCLDRAFVGGLLSEVLEFGWYGVGYDLGMVASHLKDVRASIDA